MRVLGGEWAQGSWRGGGGEFVVSRERQSARGRDVDLGEIGSKAAGPHVSECNTFLWRIIEAMRHRILIYCVAHA